MTGFEPATSWSQTSALAKLSYIPQCANVESAAESKCDARDRQRVVSRGTINVRRLDAERAAHVRSRRSSRM